jgi:hypothetical protein
MSLQWETIASGIRELWPGRYNRTLAEAIGVPRATVKAWLAGRRRMPISRMRAMAGVLRHDIAVANTTLNYLEVEIASREREAPRQRGQEPRRRYPAQCAMVRRTMINRQSGSANSYRRWSFWRNL